MTPDADVTGGWRLEPSPVEVARRAVRERRRRQSILTAAVSTTAFVLIVGFAVSSAPGWDRVSATFFSVSVAWDVLPVVAQGLWLNIRVLALAIIFVPAIGLGVALLRTLRGPVFLPLRLFAIAYVDIFRGLPLLLMLYLIGFGVPALRLEGFTPSAFWLGTVAVTITYSSYVSEVFRAGIESIHPSQRLAARSLGLSYPATMRRVILPQAVRNVTPALLNDLVALQKDVGLISILGLYDAIRRAQIEVAASFNFTPYVVAGLLFVALSVPTGRLADAVNLRAARRQQASVA